MGMHERHRPYTALNTVLGRTEYGSPFAQEIAYIMTAIDSKTNSKEIDEFSNLPNIFFQHFHNTPAHAEI